mmetsp:Transcript_46819/g.124548  ORF Transcript_46819/g.124548 Transcript_46819/m.124548 type:complete len:215 (-) Transcript_46819:130-774(-)
MDDPAVALERINGFQEACLLFFHCVLKTYTWVVDMSTHQQAMCAHSNSTLRAKERKCLTLVEFTFAGTHKFHWNNNMSFENSPILRVTGLKACLAVFYNACHTFHQCRFFLANIALQFAFRRGGLLTSNPFVLLGLLKLLDHILKGEVEWKPVHSTGHAANCSKNKNEKHTLNKNNGNNRIKPARHTGHWILLLYAVELWGIFQSPRAQSKHTL